MADHPSSNLASNLRDLRESRGLTQQQLAQLSDVPRPTLAHLESGAGNPTLLVMMKVAAALQVSIERLIAPVREPLRLYPRASLGVARRGRAQVRQLLPEPVPGIRMERLRLDAGARFDTESSAPGMRLYLACEDGEIDYESGDAACCLKCGDVLVIDSGCSVRLKNRQEGSAVVFALSVPAPAGH